MRLAKAICSAAAMLLLGAGVAMACDEYKSISQDELKDYRNKLTEQGADPLDQLFAFQQLVCSDSPTIRAYAIKTGLEGATDPILRQEIMLDAMMGKSRIDIELSAGPGSTAADKDEIKRFGGLFSKDVAFRDAATGCIGFRDTDECRTDSSIVIRGDKAEFSYTNETLIGQFQLTTSNELVGFVRVNNGDSYGRIPAVIKLF